MDPCKDKGCGEPLAIKVIGEFKQLYEGKLNSINSNAGNDPVGALEAKVAVQQSWIKDLSDQNELLVHTVAELEQEASDRVSKLEKKLESSAQTGGEVMRKYRDFDISINLDATFQTLAYLQSDMRNLLEFIRRVRDENIWCVEGLNFYEVTCEDLFGCTTYNRGMGDQNGAALMTTESDKSKQVQVMYEAPIHHEAQKKEQSLLKQIQEKEDEMKQLKKSMIDMRNALTIEVAEKHDSILGLQKDMQQLEEQRRQANKQTQFRDDIIKELRKEIKQLKGQDEELRKKREAQRANLNTIEDYAEALKQEQNERDEERAKRSQEARNLRNTITELEKALNNAQARGGDLQQIVDAYKKSTNELETSQERYKMEITQQRLTITNLQEALVATKQQVEEQQKVENDVSSSWTSWWLKGKSGGDNKSVHDV